MAHSAPRKARVAVLTVSDTRTVDSDESGQVCRALAERAGHEVTSYAIVPDDRASVVEFCRSAAPGVDAILVNGGTGIAPRDTTYEAIAALLDRRLDGFGELFRMLSYQDIGAAALASRAVAGLFGRTLVFSMPGSPKAVALAMDKLIGPQLGHLVGEVTK